MQNGKTKTIDLNADLGEGAAHDPAMLEIVSSANIACGFHAGDAVTMHRTITLARERGVAIGAHPGFADRKGFGRREMELKTGADMAAIEKIIIYQIGAMDGMAQSLGARLTHCKLHGALYTMASRDDALAMTCAMAVKAVSPQLTFTVPPNSALEKAADACGLAIAREVFADRAYDDDGHLTPRDREGAFITDPAIATQRMLDFLAHGTITTITGKNISLEAETICVHGDTENAVAMASALRDGLTESGIKIAPHKI